jgi:hypothetical protein
MLGSLAFGSRPKSAFADLVKTGALNPSSHPSVAFRIANWGKWCNAGLIPAVWHFAYISGNCVEP